jgi:hypothetical protein
MGRPTHEAFTKTVDDETETSGIRRRALAGWLVLRVVDHWFTRGRSGLTDTDPPLARAHDVVAGLLPETGDGEALALRGIIDAVDGLGDPEPGALDQLLYRYAVVLQERSAFSLAIDVLQMVVAYPHWLAARGTAAVAIDRYDSPLMDDASLRLGACYRVLGDHDRAVDAYARVQERAAARGDIERALRARLGAAKVAAVRGNLPIAEWLCDAMVTQLSEQLESSALDDRRAARALTDLRAEARHELANIVHARGFPARAIELVFTSWREVSSARERGRMLVDLAAYFRDLGALEASTDANRLAQRAQEPITRWTATVNLLELAVDRNDEESFDRQREALAAVALPPFLEAAMHLYVARGCTQFRRGRRQVSDAIASAIAVAEAHHLNKLLHDAEAYAATLVGQPAPPARARTEPESSAHAGVAHVAAALRMALDAAT